MYIITWQVKCEVIEKENFTGCERRVISNIFRFKVLHVAWSEPQRKREGQLLILIQWSTHSVKHLFNELLIQWSTHSVKLLLSIVLIQLNSRLWEEEEETANLFGLFGVRYGIPTT